jgi:hypothetical protein
MVLKLDWGSGVFEGIAPSASGFGGPKGRRKTFLPQGVSALKRLKTDKGLKGNPSFFL